MGEFSFNFSTRLLNSRRETITTIESIGIFLGLSSVAISWYFGTKNRRLKAKIANQEEKLSKITIYSSNSGYKTMIHDCFHSISYAFGLVLLILGLKTAILTLLANDQITLFLNQFIAGAYMGAGFVLLELFVILSKANKPQESSKELKEKIKILKSNLE